ncbi:MAG: hypothetical protein AB7U73_24325 [Pirellulales bacterium]
MSRYGWLLAPALAFLAPLALSGCVKHDTAISEEEHEEHGEEGHDHEGHDHEGHSHENLTEDAAVIEAELAKLSPEDMKLAELQDKKCVVSDHLLGSMGAPIKVIDVEGKDVFICCAGCEAELREHPEKYLAKIKTEE